MSEEYNVLLFGETGAGKSTFINACDTYLKHATLSEALRSKRICCRLPFKFIWQDEAYTDLTTQFGSDVNEKINDDVGKAVTQNLRVHTFGHQGKIFRFIDTPGFGDTRGCLTDSENAKKIVEFLKIRFRNLHAVCFILKASQNRDDLPFKYKVAQMLSLLHKDTLENVLLIFTHSSGDHFKSGSTYGVFKKVLDNVGIKTSWDNKRFCVDNKCFMYLLAVNLKIDTADSSDIYEDCWNKTRASYLEIFRHIQTLMPRSIGEIAQVSDLRTKLEHLHCQILPQIQKNVLKHQTELGEIESTITLCRDTIGRLSPSLYDKKIYVREGEVVRVENEAIASILGKENLKGAQAMENMSQVLSQLEGATREQDAIESDIENHVSSLKECCFVPYSKECTEQIKMEIQVKGPTKELENYLKRYEQLLEML